MTHHWELGPFAPTDAVIGLDGSELSFSCPILDRPVRWAAKDVFNPGAVVHDGKVVLLVRAEDAIGRYSGTSRIGLASSDDGVTFAMHPEPVLFPADDRWQPWEWPGGCEDPRLVEAPDGGYVCTYTAFDGKSGTLSVATSDDLVHWQKHGPAFAGSVAARRASKSGAIVTEVLDGHLVAARIDGRFRMYWGEGICFAATSEDLVHWEPTTFDATADRYLTYDEGASQPWTSHVTPGVRALRPLLFPRRGRFDSMLVEPGPPAVRTSDGIVLIVNGANRQSDGDPTLPPLSYQPGQVLFDATDPLSCVARPSEPFLRAAQVGGVTGQVGNVCFAQGLVLFGGVWRLYFGMADSRIGCATAPFDR
jgi:beta-1,2-mannosidase